MRALLVAVSRALAVALLGLASCNSGPGLATPPPATRACMHDEDCQMGACGPCEANALISSDSLTRECAVNPCPGARAYCTPAGTCAVR